MRKGYFFYLTIAGLWIITGCQKEKISTADCQRLQHGIVADEQEEVKAVINKFINSLSAPFYTRQNLDKLVQAISQQCGATVTFSCFDCIKTLPSQSEIRISYAGAGGPVERTVDITYTATNKMIFHNLHD